MTDAGHRPIVGYRLAVVTVAAGASILLAGGHGFWLPLGEHPLSISAWWNQQRAELKHRKALDENPAHFILSSVAGCAMAGRFFAGAHGVGLAVSLSIMSSSYASLATVDTDHICLASQFVSRIVQEGTVTSREFLGGGVLAAIAASLPRAVLMYRNMKLHDLWKEGTQSLPFSKWATGYSEWHVLKLFVFVQGIPLFFSTSLLLKGIAHALGLHLRASPEAIQSMWLGFKAVCGH